MIRYLGLQRAASVLALALPVLLAAIVPGGAQTIYVTAGEHAGFTRVVLQSVTGFSWAVAEDGAELRIALPGRPVRANPDTVFSRIPRTRLSALRIEDEALVLTRPCLCPARSFEDRPGVLVIDLQDGAPLPDPAATVAAPPTTPAPPAASPDPGRAAGRALARRLTTVRDAHIQAPPDLLTGATAEFDLSRTIPAEIAAAMTRGLLPAPPPAQAPRLLGAPVELSGLPALPPNLALRNADAPSPAPIPDAVDTQQRTCPPETVFAALTEPAAGTFNTQLTAARAALYGEFDQPDAANWLALAIHYLRWGLGAEARQILDLDGLGIEHREILGGVADLIEGHASNRRARLTRHLDCPGPLALFAWLAGPPGQPAAADPDPIVAVFQTLTPDLRDALASSLVRRLIADGQVEAARMVASTAGRSPGAEGSAQAILDALLDQARGELDRAAARLEAAPGTDLAALQLRLELALAQDNPLPEALLLDAETLAETVRTTDTGRTIGELVIRHHALAGRLGPGFALLDRFSQWGASGSDHRGRVAALRSALWRAAAGLDDATFLITALSRSDWRDPGLDDIARTALAARFAALGLPQLAASVGQPVPAPVAEGTEGATAPDPGAPTPAQPSPGPGAASTSGPPLAPLAAATAPEATPITPQAAAPEPSPLPGAAWIEDTERAVPRSQDPLGVLAGIAGAPPGAPQAAWPTAATVAAPQTARLASATTAAGAHGTQAATTAAGPPPVAPSVAVPPPGSPAQAPAAATTATTTEASHSVASAETESPDRPSVAMLPAVAAQSGRDPMALSQQRLEESQALRAALIELGMTRR